MVVLLSYDGRSGQGVISYNGMVRGAIPTVGERIASDMRSERGGGSTLRKASRETQSDLKRPRHVTEAGYLHI